MSNYNSILKTTSLFGGVQGLNILLNLVRTKIVALLLGPDGVGLNSIYNETRELLHSTTNLGLDVSGVRGISAAYEEFQDCDDEERRNLLAQKISSEVAVLRSWVILLALIGMLLCIVCASPLSKFTFGDYEHTWGYVILSPAVAFSTITCGEMAVLKGLRKLKSLALLSLLNVVVGLVVCIPIYFVWGIEGVLPALLMLMLVVMIVTLCYSCKAEKFVCVFTKKELRKGNKMLGVGFNFVACSIIGHFSLLGIQAYLNNSASIAMVGLYNSAYTLTMTYAGMIFAAMETDYFPRLSGVITNVIERTETLLKQQDVTVFLVSPMLVAMIVALPIIVPMLLSSEFEAIITMAQVTSIGLLYRAIYIPNAYMSLAAGDNKTFFLINLVGAIDILLVLLGYEVDGLFGMGVALTIQNFIDMIMVMVISKLKYGVTFSMSRIFTICIYSVLLMVSYLLCATLQGWMYWAAGIGMMLLCTLYSFYNYRKA